MTATISTPDSTVISGWGGYPIQQARVLMPSSHSTYKAYLQQYSCVIARVWDEATAIAQMLYRFTDFV